MIVGSKLEAAKMSLEISKQLLLGAVDVHRLTELLIQSMAATLTARMLEDDPDVLIEEVKKVGAKQMKLALKQFVEELPKNLPLLAATVVRNEHHHQFAVETFMRGHDRV